MSPFRIPAIILVSSLLAVVITANQSLGHHSHSPRKLTSFHGLFRNTGMKELYTGRFMAHKFRFAHNQVRAILNHQPLRWNRTLARYARRWANQRVNDCKLIHSPNSPYGENMFWSLRGHWDPIDVVRCWADEYKNYDPQTNQCINGAVCGHYTQVIWRSTQELGCARVTCNYGKGFLYVCSYYPPGNIYNQGPLGGRFENSVVEPPPAHKLLGR